MPRHGCNLLKRFTDFEQARDTFMSLVVEAQVFNFQNFACPRECGADGVAVMRESSGFFIGVANTMFMAGAGGRSTGRCPLCQRGVSYL